jgi:hypothetical protein
LIERFSRKKGGAMPGRKSSGRKYSKGAGKAVKSAMHRKKSGALRSGKGGKGGKVKSRKQAIAIGLSGNRLPARSLEKFCKTHDVNCQNGDSTMAQLTYHTSKPYFSTLTERCYVRFCISG